MIVLSGDAFATDGRAFADRAKGFSRSAASTYAVEITLSVTAPALLVVGYGPFVGPDTSRPLTLARAYSLEVTKAEGVSRVGTPLGDAAATVFAQLRNGQPLPVRQLAAMMRKRSLVETDPEQLAPQLKAELLGDERSYRALGLRPRIVYRGRDLFAPASPKSSERRASE